MRNPSTLLQKGKDREIASQYQETWSTIAGERIRQAMRSEKMTIVELSDRMNVSRKKLARLLNGAGNDINLAASCMVALGRNPASLLDANLDVRIVTGVTVIDDMLRDVYSDQSIDGLASIRNYLTKDYRCCCMLYRVVDEPQTDQQFEMNAALQRVCTVEKDGVELWGIDFSTEQRLNREQSKRLKVYNRLSLDAAEVIAPTTLLVDYTVIEFAPSEPAVFSSRKMLDRLELTNTVEQITAGGACRIKRKTWRQITFNRSLMVA